LLIDVNMPHQLQGVGATNYAAFSVGGHRLVVDELLFVFVSLSFD
jgi:uncharacterized protein YebE (UPF0316 family)